MLHSALCIQGLSVSRQAVHQPGRKTVASHGQHPCQRQWPAATARARQVRAAALVPSDSDDARASAQAGVATAWPSETRRLFYQLVNPELSSAALPAAKQYIDQAHNWTRTNIFGSSEDRHKLFQPFAFSEESMDERLDAIYRELADQCDKYDPAKDPIFNRRDMVLERLRQFAPNNLTDGIWLTGIPRLSGPKTKQRILLLHILEDENGNGDPALNHSNIYRDLLQQEQIYLPDPGSEEFARHSSLWDEAFELPTYLAATAQFPATGMAETLGITLAFEWTSIELTHMIKLCRSFNPPVNDHFYKLHKGIDNPLTGHGAWAVEAAKLHLASTLAAHGVDRQEEEWKRIWTAFVTFQCYGSLDDRFKRLRDPPAMSLTQQMVQMIASKSFASLSHDHATIGGKKVRDLFANPDEFVRLLSKSTAADGTKRPPLVVPGNPDASRLIQDMSPLGPMFRVFTEQEQGLVRDWITWLGSPAAGLAAVTAAAGSDDGAARLGLRSFVEVQGREDAEDVDLSKVLPRMSK